MSDQGGVGKWSISIVADPEGGGVRGFKPPLQRGFFFFFACQYMKIPTDLDPKPPFGELWPRTPPPFKEFLDPPLVYKTRHVVHSLPPAAQISVTIPGRYLFIHSISRDWNLAGTKSDRLTGNINTHHLAPYQPTELSKADTIPTTARGVDDPASRCGNRAIVLLDAATRASPCGSWPNRRGRRQKTASK